MTTYIPSRQLLCEQCQSLPFWGNAKANPEDAGGRGRGWPGPGVVQLWCHPSPPCVSLLCGQNISKGGSFTFRKSCFALRESKQENNHEVAMTVVESEGTQAFLLIFKNWFFSEWWQFYFPKSVLFQWDGYSRLTPIPKIHSATNNLIHHWNSALSHSFQNTQAWEGIHWGWSSPLAPLCPRPCSEQSLSTVTASLPWPHPHGSYVSVWNPSSDEEMAAQKVN